MSGYEILFFQKGLCSRCHSERGGWQASRLRKSVTILYIFVQWGPVQPAPAASQFQYDSMLFDPLFNCVYSSPCRGWVKMNVPVQARTQTHTHTHTHRFLAGKSPSVCEGMCRPRVPVQKGTVGSPGGVP